MICIEIHGQFRFFFAARHPKIFSMSDIGGGGPQGAPKRWFLRKIMSSKCGKYILYPTKKKVSKKTRVQCEVLEKCNWTLCWILSCVEFSPLLNPSFLRNFPLAEVCWFVFLGGRPPSAAAKQPIRCLFEIDECYFRSKTSPGKKHI